MKVQFYRQSTLPTNVTNGSIVFNTEDHRIYLGENDQWVCYVPETSKTVEQVSPDKLGYGSDAGAAQSVQLDAKKFFVVGRSSHLTITLPENSDYDCKEYCIHFFIPDNFTLSLPSAVKWQNGTAPNFESNTSCQLVICNNCATYGIFKA